MHKLYVGVTDNRWFEFLSGRNPDEVNFWRPGGTRSFKAIPLGAPFLFKLHSPLNFITGGGYFLKHTYLPVSIAWNAYEENNGAPSLNKLQSMIRGHRRDDHHDPVIGCTLLTEPFFLPREEWIPAPGSWASNIVSGRAYSESDADFKLLWEFASRFRIWNSIIREGTSIEQQRFGEEYLTRARLGQGSFRVLVLEAYNRRCAVTGEKVLPVLEAAHIRPFSEDGPHRTSNGILLRSDFHKLFDEGYITITQDHKIEVSKRIHEEFNNGQFYYSHHGKSLNSLPDQLCDMPSTEYIDWHNTRIFLG